MILTKTILSRIFINVNNPDNIQIGFYFEAAQLILKVQVETQLVRNPRKILKRKSCVRMLAIIPIKIS